MAAGGSDLQPYESRRRSADARLAQGTGVPELLPQVIAELREIALVTEAPMSAQVLSTTLVAGAGVGEVVTMSNTATDVTFSNLRIPNGLGVVVYHGGGGVSNS